MTNNYLPKVTLTPADRYQPFPLTDIQQAYWLGRSHAFESGDVGIHFYAEIESDNLDLERLEQAWQQLIARHDMMRAVILPSGEQHILAEVPPYKITVSDLRDLPAETQQTRLNSLRDELSHQVLSPEKWPLFDFRAALISHQQTRLYISLDISMFDVGSVGILFKEWHQLYENPKAELPPLSLSFRDYVLAQQTMEDGPLFKRSKAYWLNRIDDLPSAPQLPLHQNKVIKKPHFKRYQGQVDPTTWQQLKDYASEQGLTPSGILLTAFADVLTVWSKTPKFTINTTLFNRLPLHPEVTDIVGDFTTLSLVSIDNSAPSESFIMRAKRVKKQLLRDLSHRHFSAVQVLREMIRQRGGTFEATMPVVFTSVLGSKSKSQTLSLDNFGQLIYSITQTPQVWLDHQVYEEPDGTLTFFWDFLEDRYPDGLIADLFAAYCNLLKELAAGETAWESSAPVQLIPPAQLAQRVEVNTTEAPVSSELLHTPFISQVKERPYDPAVITPHRTMTYQELYQEANQAGHWLRQNGATPNTLVAVVMEKGWEQIVAVLGILMSGAAYLPIDPTLPAERQAYLLEQGEATLALTQSKLAKILPWPDNIRRLVVDQMTLEDNLPPLDVVQCPTDLAYVIYTSGSTGFPKGVVIDHQGAVNTVLDINQRFEVTAQDRVLALSALNFDLSVYDVFGLLAVGGAIVIPQDDQRLDPAHWVELMAAYGVTLWDTVPALMQMLVDYQANRPLTTNLRLIMMSGDWIPLNLPDRIKNLWPHVTTMSLGGATEASIWSIFYPIKQSDPTWRSVPYGKPLTNQTFHVLNHHLEPCPVWVPGQLYIGGIGLAKGYWRDEEKTNASFIIHPRTGERLYKTGDLGLYMPDGNIEFLGREDFQVKIRGHRIELGEIEANLFQHPDVSEVVISVTGEARELKQLVAYIVPAGGEPLNPDEIKQFLEQKLPVYMVPEAYMFLETFPLTANGKVNRHLLPAPDSSVKKEEDFVQPRTPLEEQVAAIWFEVLGLEQGGIHQSFFDAGGDSLLAVKIISRIWEDLQFEMPLRDMFETPTIAKIADYIETTRWALLEAEPAPAGIANDDYEEGEL